MENKTQQNGWFVVFIIFCTLAIFLFVILQTIPASPSPKSVPLYLKNISTETPISLKNKCLVYKGQKLENGTLNNLIQDWMKRFFESASSSIAGATQLSDKLITGIHIGKSFLLYEVKLQQETDGFRLYLTMEPPEIVVDWEDKNYAKYYPLLNPYIHVLELEYNWIWTTKPEFNLNLLKMDIQTVNWDHNKYWRNYKDTKNSPLYKMCIPEPVSWTKDQIMSLLQAIGLFQTITVVQTDLSLDEIQGTSI